MWLSIGVAAPGKPVTGIVEIEAGRMLATGRRRACQRRGFVACTAVGFDKPVMAGVLPELTSERRRVAMFRWYRGQLHRLFEMVASRVVVGLALARGQTAAGWILRWRLALGGAMSRLPATVPEWLCRACAKVVLPW